MSVLMLSAGVPSPDWTAPPGDTGGYAHVAQQVEQLAFNQWVGGSIPFMGTKRSIPGGCGYEWARFDSSREQVRLLLSAVDLVAYRKQFAIIATVGRAADL